MKKLLLPLTVLLCLAGFHTEAQNRRTPGDTTAHPGGAAPKGAEAPKSSVKPYKDVITAKAISKSGLFTVHHVDDKWYFEIPDSILGREFMAITRYSETPGGAGIYGGEVANQQTMRWEKGPDNKLFLRTVTLISIAKDSTEPIYRAVRNSYLDPIAAAFDIKAFGPDSTSTVIDVTDFFKGDNQVVSLDPNDKRRFSLGGLSPDRSYIERITTYPINTEIRTIKTWTSSPAPASFPPMPGAGRAFPAASDAGAVTFEINTSMLLLPKVPMKKRLFDPRVGFFADDYTVYTDDQQKVDESTFITRWRLEPKDEDLDRFNRGELVEPKKQIVYYIDPATPKKWRPYLIAGVNDWNKAFEQAGFKNAIIAKDWPEGDTTMSLEDARFSVIRYFASDIENAYGPNIHDPRSGEILESHVGWYHNVMKLLHDWYFIQTAAVDPRARSMKFDDELMGNLIRFVSSHEIGHTLGLRHNMGSSSTVPVEKLRDKAFVEANGHTPSIMDYARFNYVAQPEDNITEAGLFPRIGDYDRWAIQWGYHVIPGTKDEEEDKKILSKLIIDSVGHNPRLFFGTESNPFDPREQTEDLGDNSMKASAYGIKNLKRIIVKLPDWTKEEADTYNNLQQMYQQLFIQYQRYMFHVIKNIGGIYETPKSIEQSGDVYEVTPKARQQEAVAFLNEQLFTTPTWLLDKNILNKFSQPITESISDIQDAALGSILSAARLQRMEIAGNRTADPYSIEDLISDLNKGIWSELSTGKAIDSYRRNLQKSYTERLIALLDAKPGMSISFNGRSLSVSQGEDPMKSDVPAEARAALVSLRARIRAAIPGAHDALTRNHLQYLADHITDALEPRK
ncbi:zinc-dependent metalloprotease [Dinghuibacter silviterrae]|uniref:Uncharacterized protein DUF5118 n=1 Tax=Dinghuibacter silviterrae TaxID=1539049 RepID=A0A4R8DMQ6_9BACT|nr:zinc-dependent metalloprotease [Dinghuibacter silviterrae]TDW99281.1 uncharacterized protein DUF5118 [Dinghuibacter silviterrae]